MKEQSISFPLTNAEFLKVISNSFCRFLQKGTSRSTDKLKPLHGAIARDLHRRLGSDYEIISQGYGVDKEAQIQGRYIEKWVDITVTKRRKAVAGLAVKFVMQNYSQNSNNYFENMLGETANIRCNNVPYFQIFIILDKLPYYNNDGEIKKWETFSDHNISKYVMMSKDNTDLYLHTPSKTLIFVVHIDEGKDLPVTKEQYLNFYRNTEWNISISSHQYERLDRAVILNDYGTFIDKVYHAILSH